MKSPLVSICCIAYNHGQYIREALDGFLMQETNFPFEVLIHDDASVDNTADIIREYATKYPDIIKPIYQKENQYSKGIEILSTYIYPKVKGKYIALCEGDDYWTDPKKLQKQVDFLEHNDDYGLVCTNYNTLYQETFNLESAVHEYQCDQDIQGVFNSWKIVTCTVMINTKLLIDYLKFIDDKKILIKLIGDTPMWLWMLHQSKIHYLSDVTTTYRVLKNSASHFNGNYRREYAFNIDLVRIYENLYANHILSLEEYNDLKMSAYMNFWRSFLRNFDFKRFLYSMYFHLKKKSLIQFVHSVYRVLIFKKN